MTYKNRMKKKGTRKQRKITGGENDDDIGDDLWKPLGGMALFLGTIIAISYFGKIK